MGTKLYNKLPNYIKNLENLKPFKKQIKAFLLQQTFYSVDEYFVAYADIICICRYYALLYTGIIVTPMYSKCYKYCVIGRTMYMDILSNMYE